MPKSNLPTLDEAIEIALSEVNEPIEISTFVDRVLEIRPSSAKRPSSSVRTKMREYRAGKSLVFLDKETIVPLRVAVPGIRFRIPLSRLEVNRRALIIDPAFSGWVRHSDDPETLELIDQEGQQIPTRVVSVKQNVVSILGNSDTQSRAFDLSDWSSARKMLRNDSILVTFENWGPKRFRLELEPQKKRLRNHEEIARKNQELADILFDMLESSFGESISIYEAILTAHIRLSDPSGYPGDHWNNVIEEDPRMKFSGWNDITYTENRNMFESMFMDETPPPMEQKFTPEQGNQVYSFKAALKYRKGLWRLIEIQGKQTLADFDAILRGVFKHDTSDHLSGFWKSIRRGKGNRYREIDLGNINPFQSGGAADLTIAGLGLQVGDKLKYVYDFGDWVEHEITLETVEPSQARIKYPLISEQNKPRYKYCEHCKDEGRKEVATYICIECSDDEQRQVLVCEDCLDEHHEDHYIDEVIY